MFYIESSELLNEQIVSKSETHKFYKNHYEIVYDDGTLEQVTSENKTIITSTNGNITAYFSDNTMLVYNKENNIFTFDCEKTSGLKLIYNLYENNIDLKICIPTEKKNIILIRNKMNLVCLIDLDLEMSGEKKFLVN